MKDKEMTYEEKLNVMKKLGLQKEWAKWELNLENEYFAVLPSFRFLKPISLGCNGRSFGRRVIFRAVGQRLD